MHSGVYIVLGWTGVAAFGGAVQDDILMNFSLATSRSA